ncbi:amine oxidase [copper-containing] 3-like [Ambystoma mexicanum]|uniref:amine oxidase [copper-containing] 3-like n=1 Tax=Ambystoma mexicanum TaxID=8296 RepID=UPI0037E9839D
MNLKAVLVLFALALATIIALVCVLLSGAAKAKNCSAQSQDNLEKDPTGQPQSHVFSDLSPMELSQVVQYLKENLGVDLVDAAEASPSDNCIYFLDVQYPKKQEALNYLDKSGPRPKREALAVVFFGNQQVPNITEYVVGPLPAPTYHLDITLQKHKSQHAYSRRSVIGNEYIEMYSFVYQKEFRKAPTFMTETFGYDGTNFGALAIVSPGLQSGDRSTWLVLFQNVSGSAFFLHPVGLEVLVDHKSLDISKWRVLKVFYRGEYFNDMHQLEEEYKAGKVSVVRMRHLPAEDIASMKPRRLGTANTPFQYEPTGPRYSVKDNQVTFMSWRFAFGKSVNSGLRLFDVRFNGDRIAYELSSQEAISIYGSNAPGGMATRYIDSSYGIGRTSHELVRGVDCPYFATYVDTHHLIDSQTPETVKNSICIFEQNSGSPLRRHYSNLHSMYYGGLPSTILVIRAISTLINYDYVWDFIFYQNGAIEAKISATGYISSSFLYGDGLDFGSRVGEHTLGTLHSHFINYKVDLDVGGTANSILTQDMKYETFSVPWQPEIKIQRPKVVREVLEKENQAAYGQNDKMPRYVHFASNKTNKWGHQRSYRIQILSFAGENLPEASPVENAMNWARYKLAVTKHKDDEPQSSSIFNQNDPWSPTVKFTDFINDENIKDEDLVAWITTGFLHIPHAEDIPNTVTAGNSVGFYLRPYNYFDQDPSIFSTDGVYFRGDQDYTSCEVNQAACMSKESVCRPEIPKFTYDGFQHLVTT